MDFVISKVMMSICALTVVSILGGLAGSDIFRDPNSELSGILRSFNDSVEAVAGSGPGSHLTWTVPGRPDGESVELLIHTDFVRCASERNACVLCANVRLHLWTWDGTPLNETISAQLDKETTMLKAATGDTLDIGCREVLFDNDPRDLTFIRLVT